MFLCFQDYFVYLYATFKRKSLIFKFRLRKLRKKVFVTVQWSKSVVGTERWHIPMILIDIAPPSSENWPKMDIFVDEEGIAYIELAEITIDSHRIKFDAFRYTYTPTGHCEPRIKENAVHCQPIEREHDSSLMQPTAQLAAVLPHLCTSTHAISIAPPHSPPLLLLLSLLLPTSPLFSSCFHH